MDRELLVQQPVVHAIESKVVSSHKPECKDGNAELHLAVRDGNIDLIQMLLEQGADVNTRNDLWLTPLHFAANKNEIEIVKMLLDHGAKVNVLTNFDYTPLHYAAYQGKVKIVTLLIEKGAVLNIQNVFGHTPLHSAASHEKVMFNCDGCNANRFAFCLANHGRTEVARVLIENGAKLRLEDEDGLTALELAKKSGSLEIANLIEASGLF